jgi:hypothetical protein
VTLVTALVILVLVLAGLLFITGHL